MTEANLSANTANAEIPPMPFGFTLDRVYRILRDHLKLFLGIGAMPGVAMMLLYGAMMGVMFAYLWPYMPKNGEPPTAFPDQFMMMRIMIPMTLLTMIPIIAVMAFYLAAAFHAANRIDSGIATTVRESYSEAWRRLGRSLLLLISVYLRAFGLALGILLVCFAGFGLLSVGGTSQNPPTAAIAVFPIMMILYFPAYVYGVIVALRLSLAFPAWMEEELTTGEAMRRSSQLTKGSKGRIFLLLLVIYAITYAFLFVFYLLGIVFFAIGALGMTAMHMHPTDPAFIVGICVAGVILLVLIFVWMALLYGSIVIMLSVVYHDQRRRKDAPLPAQLPVTGAELPPGAQPA